MSSVENHGSLLINSVELRIDQHEVDQLYTIDAYTNHCTVAFGVKRAIRMSFLPNVYRSDELFNSWTTRDKIHAETAHYVEKAKQAETETTHSRQAPPSSSARERNKSSRRPRSKAASNDGVHSSDSSRGKVIDEWFQHYVSSFGRPKRTEALSKAFTEKDGRFRHLKDSMLHKYIERARVKDQYFIENAVAEREYYRKKKVGEELMLEEEERKAQEYIKKNLTVQERLYDNWKRKMAEQRRKARAKLVEEHAPAKQPQPPKAKKLPKNNESRRQFNLPNWIKDREEYADACKRMGKRDVQIVSRILKQPVSQRSSDELDVVAKWLNDQGPLFSELRHSYLHRVSTNMALEQIGSDRLIHTKAEYAATSSSNEPQGLYIILQGCVLALEGTTVDILKPGDSFGNEQWYHTLRRGLRRREKRVSSERTSGIQTARAALEQEATTFGSKISSIIRRRSSFGLPHSYSASTQQSSADEPLAAPNFLNMKTPLDVEGKYFRALSGSNNEKGNWLPILFFTAPDYDNNENGFFCSIARRLLKICPTHDLVTRFDLDPDIFANKNQEKRILEYISECLKLSKRAEESLAEFEKVTVEAARINLNDFNVAMELEKAREAQNLVPWLHSKMPIFTSFNIPKILSIAKSAELMSFREGEMVYAQDSPADYVCILKEGMVEAITRVPVKYSYRVPTSPRSEEPQSKTDKFRNLGLSQVQDVYVKVRRIHPGEIFGEEAILSTLPEEIVVQAHITKQSNMKHQLVKEEPDKVFFLPRKDTRSRNPHHKYDWLDTKTLLWHVREFMKRAKDKSEAAREGTVEDHRQDETQTTHGVFGSSFNVQELRKYLAEIQERQRFVKFTPQADPSRVLRPHNIVAVRPCEVIFLRKEYLGHLCHQESDTLINLLKAALLHPSQEELAAEQIQALRTLCKDRQDIVSHLGHRYSSRVYEEKSTGRQLGVNSSGFQQASNYANVSVAAKKKAEQQYTSATPSSPRDSKENMGSERKKGNTDNSALLQGAILGRKMLTSFPISLHARESSDYVTTIREASVANNKGARQKSDEANPAPQDRVPKLALELLQQATGTEEVTPKFVAKAISSERSTIGASNSRRCGMWEPVYDAEEDDVLCAFNTSPYRSPREEEGNVSYFDNERLHEELFSGGSNFHRVFDSVLENLEGYSDKELLQRLSDATAKSRQNKPFDRNKIVYRGV